MRKEASITFISVQELHKKKKRLLGALIGLGLVLLMAGAIIFYLAFSSKMPKVLIVVPICSSLTLLPAFISLSQINTELKNRKAKI
jgi:flagellar basal body-associated protein FliL